MRHSRLALAGLAIVTAACGQSRTDRAVETTSSGGTTVTPAGDDAASRGTTLVRFVNVMPASVGMDLVSNDQPLFVNVAYKAVTPYAELHPNVTRLALRSNARDSVLAENRELVGDGAHYTVVAYPDEDGKPKLRVLRDELRPEAGKAKLRVIHAAGDLPGVQVSIQGAPEPIFRDVGEGHEAGFTAVDPTRSPIVIRRDAQSGPLLTVSTLPLEASHAYTIVLTRTPQRRLEAVTFQDQLTGTAPH